MCFECSIDLSYWEDRFFEYPQHMFWMRNKENSFPIHTLIWRPECNQYFKKGLDNKTFSVKMLTDSYLFIFTCIGSPQKPPQWGNSFEYLQYMLVEKNRKLFLIYVLSCVFITGSVNDIVVDGSVSLCFLIYAPFSSPHFSRSDSTRISSISFLLWVQTLWQRK